MKKCDKCGKELSDEAIFCPKCGESQVGPKGDPMLGQVVVERYLIRELRGEGGSGTVYRARHVGLQQMVAVKFLHHHLSHDETAIERFRREATTVASIDNEHIIEVKDFGRAEDGRFFMVMEFLEGQTLKELLNRQSPLDPLEALDIALQVGAALMEAHGMGYIHRDLRPGNIFLTSRKGKKNFVKLMDFGLSKLIVPGDVQPQSTIGITFGDPVYISPEQARGEKVDRRSDIYSLGVILYEMLTGSAPFSGKEIVQILDQHAEALPELPSKRRPGLPSAVDAVLMKALAKNADSRYVTVLNFNEALENAFADFKGIAEPKGPAAPDSPPAAAAAAETPEPETAAKKKPSETASYEVTAAKRTPAVATAGKAGPAADIPPGETLQCAVPGPIRPPERKAAAKPVDTGAGAAATQAAASKVGPEAGPTASGAEPAATGAVEPAATGAAQPAASEAQPASAQPAQPEPAAGREEPEKKEAGSEAEPAGEEAVPDPTMSQMWYAEGEEAQRALREMAEREKTEQTAPALPAMYERMDKAPSSGPKIVMLLAGGLAVVFVVALIVIGMRAAREESPGEGKGTASAEAQKDSAPAPARPDATAAVARRDAEPSAKAAPDAARPERRPLVLDPDGLVIKGPQGPEARKPRARRPGDSRGRPDGLPPDPRKVTPPGPEVTPKKLAKEEVALGRASLRRGNLGQAAAHFQKARKIDPRNGSALAGLGEVAFEQGKYTTAAKHLTAALRYTGSVRTMVMLGNAYFKLGRYVSAEKMFAKVLKRQPSHAEAKRNLKVVRRRLGKSGTPP